MTSTPTGRLIRHGGLTLHTHDCVTPINVATPDGGVRGPKTGDEWQCGTCFAVYVYTSPGRYRRGGWMLDRQTVSLLPELPDPRAIGGPP